MIVQRAPMTSLTGKSHVDMDQLANRLFDAMKQAYAPDVVYCMNAIPETQGLDALLELTRFFHQKVKNLHYEIESREFFAGGLVQRCKILGEIASGDTFAVPLCLIIFLEDGRIVRLHEYLDTASMMHIFA